MTKEDSSSRKKLISLHNVGITYKIRGNLFRRPSYCTALRGISLDVYRGEVLGITGSNGTGKSTLLQVIAGILRPDEGRITNRGHSVSLLSLQAGFDDDLTGRDNIIINGMLLGYGKRFSTTRIPDIVSFSGLEKFIDKPVRTYSSGMRARLGFSISMYLSPDILLLDEVHEELGAGDREFRTKSFRVLEQKLASGQTVVMVSHTKKHVGLCDRTLTLETPG